MASIVPRPRNVWWVQFRRDRKRYTCYLGKTTKGAAEEFKRNVDELLLTAKPGARPSAEVAAWLDRMGDGPHRTLARAGLVRPRGAEATERAEARLAKARKKRKKTRTVGDVVRLALKVIEERVADGDAGDATLRNAKRTADGILTFWGEDHPAKRIKQRVEDGGDKKSAQDYRRWLKKDGRKKGKAELADSTVSRRCRRAREFFEHAVRKGWLRENPFGAMRLPAEVAQAGRECYVPTAWIEEAIEETYDLEMRLLLAYARYAGVRGESEIAGVLLTDFNLSKRKLMIRSPKTERAGKAFRWMPLWPAIEKHYVALMEHAKPGQTKAFPRFGEMPGSGIVAACERVLIQAGVTPWPRFFVNCRSSCEEDLMELHSPRKVITWLGHSARVAQRHYDRAEEKWAIADDAPLPEWCRLPLPCRQAPQEAAGQEDPHAVSS